MPSMITVTQTSTAMTSPASYFQMNRGGGVREPTKRTQQGWGRGGGEKQTIGGGVRRVR